MNWGRYMNNIQTSSKIKYFLKWAQYIWVRTTTACSWSVGRRWNSLKRTREQCLQDISFLPALTGGSFRAASVVNPSSFSEAALEVIPFHSLPSTRRCWESNGPPSPRRPTLRSPSHAGSSSPDPRLALKFDEKPLKVYVSVCPSL